MAVMIKCKMCGGDLSLTVGSTIATCEYCGTTQTVPSQDNEKKLAQFARANQHRSDCEFDKAAGVYETIVADFPGEAEAYWGLLLCKYGIEYVDDPATGKKVPTCHRSSFDSVMEDKDFEQVMDTADIVARKVYREEARQIEKIRKGIIEVSTKEEPYDIFICYKETDEKGQRTIDSVLAQDIYNALTEKGYRVFFSRISLEDKLGQEYEPYIFAALNSAKIMLAVGTDYEHYNAVWVKNEWSRYLKLIAKGEKKTLIPCFKDIDAYDMPKEFRALQAQDLGKVGSMQDLLRGVDKLLAVPVKVKPTGNDDAAMEAFLKDKARREVDETKKSRKKKAISLAVWTLVVAFALLIFTVYDVQGRTGYVILDCFEYLIEGGGIFPLPGIVIAFLFANLLAWIVQGFALAVCVQRTFQSKLGYGLLCLSWVIMIGSFTVCEFFGTRILPTGFLGYNLMVYLSYAFMLVMTMVMNWPPKKFRFWIALALYVFLLFVGNIGTSTFSTITYNAGVRHMENDRYDKAIAAFARLDDYKDSREKIVQICTDQDYLKSQNVGDTFFFGSYEQDNNLDNGKEPILWRVLDKRDGQLLVISEQSLDAVAYHSTHTENVTWETCALNSWLCNDFAAAAFVQEETARVRGAVTLLTAEQATQYFASNSDRLCIATYYTERYKVGSPLNANGKYDDWWLQGVNTTPMDDAPIIDTHGNVSEESIEGNNPLFQYVRPAMWIEIDSTNAG